MLIEFTVENYLSFKEKVTFSMVASNIKQHTDTHIFKEHDYSLLKSAAIYGANASGKSNLLNAISFARNFVINSSKEHNSKELIDVEPFLLSTETDNEPSTFEFVFIKDDKKYRYGFRVNEKEIVDEWLFEAKIIKEKKLFERSYKKIKITEDFKEGKGLDSKTRENSLFLSTMDQLNGPIAKSIMDWFYNLNVISGLKTYTGVTLEKIEKDSLFKQKFIEILKITDLSIEDFKIKPVDSSKIPDYIKQMVKEKEVRTVEVKTIHKKYGADNKLESLIEFDLDKNESKGTQKLFSILGPILDTIMNGKILVIDEFDVTLHPLITKLLISLFNSDECNKHNAQLVFISHDTNLLNKDLLRRDQIWFAEKDQYGKTDLYSLIDYDVRHDRSFAKDYLKGKYGAIPFIGSFDFFCDENQEEVT